VKSAFPASMNCSVSFMVRDSRSSVAKRKTGGGGNRRDPSDQGAEVEFAQAAVFNVIDGQQDNHSQSITYAQGTIPPDKLQDKLTPEHLHEEVKEKSAHRYF